MLQALSLHLCRHLSLLEVLAGVTRRRVAEVVQVTTGVVAELSCQTMAVKFLDLEAVDMT